MPGRASQVEKLFRVTSNGWPSCSTQVCLLSAVHVVHKVHRGSIENQRIGDDDYIVFVHRFAHCIAGISMHFSSAVFGCEALQRFQMIPTDVMSSSDRSYRIAYQHNCISCRLLTILPKAYSLAFFLLLQNYMCRSHPIIQQNICSSLSNSKCHVRRLHIQFTSYADEWLESLVMISLFSSAIFKPSVH